MSVKKLESFEKKPVEAGTRTQIQVLIGTDRGPHFAMRRFIISSGGFMPLHTNSVEHEQLVLKGRAEVRLGNETVIVSKDDVVYIPAGQPHSYKNLGEEDFEFICVVPNQEDKLEILED